jgi:DNA-binding MarR family transcriptional regulator
MNRQYLNKEDISHNAILDNTQHTAYNTQYVAYFISGRRSVMEQINRISITDKRYEFAVRFFSLNNRLQAEGDHFYKEVTFKQFFLLACMQLFGDSQPSLQELSEAMGCSRQNTKVIAQKLADSGYIKMNADSRDKRKQRLSLTDSALQLGKEYESQDAKIMKMLFDGISDEQLKQVKSVFEEIDSNLVRISEWCRKEGDKTK